MKTSDDQICNLDNFDWSDEIIGKEISEYLTLPLSRICSSGDYVTTIAGVGINDGLYLYINEKRVILSIKGSRINDIAYAVLNMNREIVALYSSKKRADECAEDDETYKVEAHSLIV